MQGGNSEAQVHRHQLQNDSRLPQYRLDFRLRPCGEGGRRPAVITSAGSGDARTTRYAHAWRSDDWRSPCMRTKMPFYLQIFSIETVNSDGVRVSRSEEVYNCAWLRYRKTDSESRMRLNRVSIRNVRWHFFPTESVECIKSW